MSNSGVFDVNDIRYLMDYQQWSGVGTLELIETQTASSQNIDFTSLGDYDVHFLTVNDHTFPAGSQDYGIRFYESGTLETASVYQYAGQELSVTGSASESKSTGANYIRVDNTGSEQWVSNWYMYFYNLKDSTKYSFVTYQRMPERLSSGGSYNAGGTSMEFGSGVLPQASTVDGIRVYNSSQTASSGSLSLYGIRYS